MSRDYRRSRAVYLDVNHPQDMRAAFETLGLGAEEILGIGDWGVNGADISIGKLAVYTAAAGIHPDRVIAVNLDVGTDNELLPNAPAYLGNRHARVRGERHDALIDEYLKTAAEMFPRALLHFEDFGPSNARRILVKNRDQYHILNDDMQGTGAIVMAAVFSGLKVTKQGFAEQRLVVYGAGTGMADQISAAMQREGLSREEAKKRVWLIDINGLVTDGMKNLPDYQQECARPASEVAAWQRENGKIGLLEVVRQIKPTILMGAFTDHGAFAEPVVKALCAGVERPILLPLSNPTEKIEVMPAPMPLPGANGKALISVGIPVPPVPYQGVHYEIGQANNAMLYPGLGLGVIVSGAKHVTDGMLLAAAEVVASQVNPLDVGASLLPPVDNLRASSATVAVAVAKQAAKDGVATRQPENRVQAVQDAMWQPVYSNE